MLRAGEKTNAKDRIRSNMLSKNNPAAPLSVLRKDHKPCESEEVGPPGRPVCGGDVSYNRKLSHLISLMLTDLYVHEETVCLSTEGLLAEVNRINEEGIDETHIVGSADLEALYPSLDIEFTVDKVCELFEQSHVNIKEVNHKELSLYLSLNKVGVTGHSNKTKQDLMQNYKPWESTTTVRRGEATEDQDQTLPGVG